MFYSCSAEYEHMQNKEFAKSLERKGHTCVYVFDSYPAEVHWCQQEPCTDNDNDIHTIMF